MLAVLAGTYTAIRLALLLWRWQEMADDALGTAMVRRYVVILLLRLRIRRFLPELTAVGALGVVLALLVRLHWQ